MTNYAKICYEKGGATPHENFNKLTKGVEMKKAKIFITGIIMVLATAFMSACSCSEGEFSPIAETGISIRCVNPSENIKCEKDENSGYLTIECYKGDRFTIEYTLTPSNVTTTQVDWEFSDNSGVLSTSTFSYSKGAVESVSFTAKNVGSTVITFKTKTTGKISLAKVKVKKEKAKIPTLDAPSIFEYNIDSGEASWNNVTKVWQSNTLQDANPTVGSGDDKVAKGLTGYSVSICEMEYSVVTDASGRKAVLGEVADTQKTVTVSTNKITADEAGFVAGKIYKLKVKALGNDEDVFTSADSKEFMFCQLETVSDLRVNNGEISFTSSKYSVSSEITYGEKAITKTSSSSGLITDMGNYEYTGDSAIKYTSFDDLNEYGVSVVCKPRGVDNDKGYATEDGVRFYPSARSSVVTFKKLGSTTIALENKTGSFTIGEVAFKDVNTKTVLKLNGKDTGTSKADEVKYQYFVASNELSSDQLKEISPSQNGNLVLSDKSTTITVFITSESEVDITSGKIVYARLVGNSERTIAGEWTNFFYTRLGKIYNSDNSAGEIIGDNAVASHSISNNVITVGGANGISGIEFFFVNSANPDLSKYVLSSSASCDISKVGLSAGNYQIYAKMVGDFGDGIKTLTATEVSKNPIYTCQVLGNVASSQISSNGTISFAPVSYSNGTDTEELKNYTIRLSKNGSVQEVSLKDGGDLNDGVVPLLKVAGKYTFSLSDAVRVLLARVDSKEVVAIEEEEIDEYLMAGATFYYTIVTDKNDDASEVGSNAIISSSGASDVYFSRRSPITNMSLEDSTKLVFDKVGERYVVILKTASGDIVSEETSGSVSGGKVTINLTELSRKDSTSKLIDYITEEQVKIEAYVVGSPSGVGITGIIDSAKVSVIFNRSGVATNLAMNPSGELSWSATSTVSGISYVINFYVGSVRVAQKSVGYSSGTQDDDKRDYKLNVLEVLGDYEGQVVAMEIWETHPSCFASKASDKIYATVLTTVNVTRASNATSPKITWSSVNRSSQYMLTCNEAIFEGATDKTKTLSVVGNEYTLPIGLAEGNYTITIVAEGDNTQTSGASSENPYILSSSSIATGENSPTIGISVRDGRVGARVSSDGEGVVWTYDDGITYEIYYKLSSASDYGSQVSSGDIQILSGERYLSFAEMEAGEYNIKIKTSVDYVSTGIWLSDDTKEVSVTKLPAVEGISASNGMAKFTYGSLDDEAISIQQVSFKLYKDGNLISSIGNNYTIESVAYDFKVDFYGLPSGEFDLTLRATQDGCISSNMSSAKRLTKVNEISDITMSNEKLQWSYVDGAEMFEIVLDENDTMKLKVAKSGDNYTCQIYDDVDGEGTYTASESFKYDSTISKFVYTPSIVLDAGKHTFKIRALASQDPYLNGNGASVDVVKLATASSDLVSVSESGKFAYGYYETFEGFEPTSVKIVINKYKVATIDAEEGSEGDPTYVIDDLVTPIERTIPFGEYGALATSDGGVYEIDIRGMEGYDEDGTYGTTIKFIGNGGKVLSSEDSSAFTFAKAERVTSIQSKDGSLVWASSVEGGSYLVQIRNSQNQLVASFNYSGDGDITLPAVISEGDGISDVKVYASEAETGETTFEYTPGEAYKIAIITQKSGMLCSELSSEFGFKKLMAPTALSMDIYDESGNGVGKPVLNWNNPNKDKTQYDLKIVLFNQNGEEGKTATFSSTESKQNYELTNDVAVGKYDIRMMAMGNTSLSFGLLYSDYSIVTNDCKVEYIENSTTPSVSNGKLSWSILPSAVTYKIVITDSTSKTATIYKNGSDINLNSDEYSSQIGMLNSGYWDISVTAITNPQIAMISALASGNSSTEAYRPGMLGTYKVKEGKLSWTISTIEMISYLNGIEFSASGEGPDEEEATGASVVTRIAGETRGSVSYDGFYDYIRDMALNGSSEISTFDSIFTEHFYKIRLKINGVETTDTPSDVRLLNASGEVVTDGNQAAKFEFLYDVSISSEYDNNTGEVSNKVTNTAGIEYTAGYYNISISAVGGENVLDGVQSGVLKTYKLTTPKSWYDKVLVEDKDDTEDDIMTLDDELDGEGDPSEGGTDEPKYTVNDISNGKALWELSVVLNQDTTSEEKLTYHKDYYLTAFTSGSESVAYAEVSIGDLDGEDKDPNVGDDYKYSKDITEMFYNETTKIELDKIYRLFIMATGTKDSTPASDGSDTVYLLNSNSYMFSDTMTMLQTCETNVEESVFKWTPNQNSVSSLIKVYGPLYKAESVESAEENWATLNSTKLLLAKIKFAESDQKDDSVFEEFGFDDNQLNQVKLDVKNNATELLEMIHEIKSGVDDERTGEVTISDNAIYAEGGYAIYEQEIGNGRGVVDSPVSEVVYAYKLGTTSAKSTKDGLPYWLGSFEKAGMFEWNPVPFANAYIISIKKIDANADANTSPELCGTTTVVYNQTYFDMPDDPSLNESGVKYSIEIIATRLDEVTAGDGGVATYVTSKNYFNSDTVKTHKVEDEENKIWSGSYLRLAIPTGLGVSKEGKIWWNGRANDTTGNVNTYAISYQWGNGQELEVEYSQNAIADIHDGILGTTNIRVKAIANSSAGYLNSAYSATLEITRIADPEPTVENGVFGWGTSEDKKAGQSVTLPELTIDGNAITISSTSTLTYNYFTEINVDNFQTYNSTTDTQTYGVGDHNITIKYTGTEGTTDSHVGDRFYLASSVKNFYITKLQTPTLENVPNTSASQESKVRWNLQNGASAYRIKFYARNSDGTYSEYIYTIYKEVNSSARVEIKYPERTDVETESGLTWSSNSYFETTETQMIFKMNNLINKLGSSGSEICAYVQAIGTIEATDGLGSTSDNRAIVNSSYSAKLDISIPSAPENAQYDNATGTLSWTLSNKEHIDTGFNIILETTYKVERLSNDELNAWLKSAHYTSPLSGTKPNFIQNATSNSGFDSDYLDDSEVEERRISYNQGASAPFTIYVKDVIVLISGESKPTPTSYQLKAVASEYDFYLTTTAYETASSDKGSYKSGTYHPENLDVSMTLFGSGNGTKYIPYTVDSYAHLNNIRKYPTSEYKIASDIRIESSSENVSNYNPNWEMISAFSGVIDGDNHYIYNVTPQVKESDNTSYMSFILDNYGTIKNTNFQVNIDYSNTSDVSEYLVSGVAIRNYGTIDNVNLLPYLTDKNGNRVDEGSSNIDYSKSLEAQIIVSAKTQVAILVGGIVASNMGTIKNSVVKANIEASTNTTAKAGGIAGKTSGGSTIENCSFGAILNGYNELYVGRIFANNVSGIVVYTEKNDDNGDVSITKCYVDENVELAVTDEGLDENDTNETRSGVLGAIICDIGSGTNVNISMCYTLAKVEVTHSTSSAGNKANQILVAGIVASASEGGSVTIDKCYTIVNYTFTTHSRLSAFAISRIGTVTNSYYIFGSSEVTLDQGETGTKLSSSTVGGNTATALDVLKTTLAEWYDVSGTYPRHK